MSPIANQESTPLAYSDELKRKKKLAIACLGAWAVMIGSVIIYFYVKEQKKVDR